MARLTIAEVLPEDMDQAFTLTRRVIGVTFADRDTESAEMTGNALGNLRWWQANPEKCCHLKAVSDDRLAGVILVKNFWNMCSLFVEPEFQRQGIGRALVMAAAGRCRDENGVEALCLNAAPDAVGFYTRLGFTQRTPARPLPPGFQAMMLAL
jgi:GNAT superfamily N-acetyltransferase